MTLDFDTLPRNVDGAILGTYRVSVPGLVLEGYEDAVEGYDVMRLHAVHGSSLRIVRDEPAESRTVESEHPSASIKRRKIRR